MARKRAARRTQATPPPIPTVRVDDAESLARHLCEEWLACRRRDARLQALASENELLRHLLAGGRVEVAPLNVPDLHGAEADEVAAWRELERERASWVEAASAGLLPHVDAEELAILQALVESGRAMAQYDLADAAELSRGTVSDRLHRLRRVGLVAYPEGKSRLTIVTARGRTVVKKIG